MSEKETLEYVSLENIFQALNDKVRFLCAVFICIAALLANSILFLLILFLIEIHCANYFGRLSQVRKLTKIVFPFGILISVIPLCLCSGGKEIITLPWGYLGTENFYLCIATWLKIPTALIPLMLYRTTQLLQTPEEVLATVPKNKKAATIKKVARKYKRKTTCANLFPVSRTTINSSNEQENTEEIFNPFNSKNESTFNTETISPLTTIASFFSSDKGTPSKRTVREAKELGNDAYQRFIREVNNIELESAYLDTPLDKSLNSNGIESLNKSEVFTLASCFCLILCGFLCSVFNHFLVF